MQRGINVFYFLEPKDDNEDESLTEENKNSVEEDDNSEDNEGRSNVLEKKFISVLTYLGNGLSLNRKKSVYAVIYL